MAEEFLSKEGLVTYHTRITKNIDKKADVTGNIATATRLKSPRTISVEGAVTAQGKKFDGSEDIVINITELKAENLTQDADNILVLDGNG